MSYLRTLSPTSSKERLSPQTPTPTPQPKNPNSKAQTPWPTSSKNDCTVRPGALPGSTSVTPLLGCTIAPVTHVTIL